MYAKEYGNIIELICPVCKRVFVPAIEHVYRMSSGRPVCSWRCLCEYRRKKTMRRGGPVLQYNLDGTFVAEWESANAAAAVMGVEPHAIRDCAIGRTKKSCGYIWRYKRKMTSASDTLIGCILQSTAEEESRKNEGTKV